MTAPIKVPVVIIGGGGCGLNLSIFLSDYNVEHFLFERHAGTSNQPKSQYLNPRSLEAARQHNFDQDLYAAGSKIRNFSRNVWMTSLGGTESFDRKVIAAVSSARDEFHPGYAKNKRAIVTRGCNLPQIYSEPLFLKHSKERNPDKVLFSHNVLDVVDNGDFVLVTVQDPKGKKTDYHAQYVVGADGGKMVGEKIGVQMTGPRGVAHIVTAHFEADLSEYWDDRWLIAHFINPGYETALDSGALIATGPNWGRHGKCWAFHFGFLPNDPARFDEEKIQPRIRALLKIPNLQMKIHNIGHWDVERVLADKYRVGRVFLAGDAAHRHPPTTGLGLNTAIGDAHNIAWKLAHVIHGKAGPEILDTYESERRPIGKRNCDWALFTWKNALVIDASFGMIPGQKEYNRAHFITMLEDTEEGRSFRAQITEVMNTSKIEFNAVDLELGFVYANGLLIPDGTERIQMDPLGQIYHPSTRPGHRLPHAWLYRKDDEDENPLSTHDLIGMKDLLLITDDHGSSWVKAASEASARFGITLAVAQIGLAPTLDLRHCEYIDMDEVWEEEKEIHKGGAIIVRPDNMVAWRSKKPSNDDGAEIAEVLEALLRKKMSKLLN